MISFFGYSINLDLEKQYFYLIGSQSNGGTNSSNVTDQTPTGRVDYSLIPSELEGVQNYSVWDGSGFSPFTHTIGNEYGWINHFLKDFSDLGNEVSFYKYGRGGNQLTVGSPYANYPRTVLKVNGLNAWNFFKQNNTNPEIRFIWCQGYTDGLIEANALNYGAHEPTNPNHATGGVLGAWFQEVRDHFGEPNMKIYYNELSNNAIGSTYRDLIKLGQQYVSTLSENNILVPSDDLDFQDTAHYSNIGVVGLASNYLDKTINAISGSSSAFIQQEGSVYQGSYSYSNSSGEIENNEPPFATDISVTGDRPIGNTLTLNYTFNSPSNYAEGTPIIQWYRRDRDTLVEELISGENNLTYITVSDDDGKDVYPKFRVTQTATSPQNGNPQSELYTAPSIIAGTVMTRLFGIDYNGNSTIDGWQSITDSSTSGFLLNILGSGIDYNIETDYSGVNAGGGEITGDDSGIQLDAILDRSFFVNNTDVAESRLSGFTPGQSVELNIGGSRTGNNNDTIVTLFVGTAEEVSITFNHTSNTTDQAEFRNIVADVNGEIPIRIEGTPGFGYHGWTEVFAAI